MLSASANKLSKLKEQAAEYAALIMEELDVDRVGYIEVLTCSRLFLFTNTFKAKKCERGRTTERSLVADELE